MASRKTSGHQDLRVQRTYRLLKDAFLQLLSQKSFEQITVLEICEAAMIRRTTFYQHFEDKHDFLAWFIEEQQLEFTHYATSDLSPNDLQEYYAQAIRNVLKYLNVHEKKIRLLLGTGIQSQLLMDAFSRSCVTAIIQRLEQVPKIEEKLGGLPIPFMAEFYIGGLIAAARWWFAQGKPCSPEQMADYIRRIIGPPIENKALFP